MKKVSGATSIASHQSLPLPSCAGAWNTDELHVSPVNGLLLHVIEQWLVEHEQAALTIVRVSLDYLGVVDFTECTTSVEVLSP